MDHIWTDGEMGRTIDICLEHPPGPRRMEAGERLCSAINDRRPRTLVTPSAMIAALDAATNAIEGGTPNWKPSKRLLELIDARRTQGTLKKSW